MTTSWRDKLDAVIKQSQNVDGLVSQYIGFFIMERQKTNDSVGYAVFQHAQKAVQSAIEKKVLTPNNKGKLSNQTLLTFSSSDSTTSSEEEIYEALRNNKAWVAIRQQVGKKDKTVQKSLYKILCQLPKYAINCFRFKSLVDAMKKDVRALFPQPEIISKDDPENDSELPSTELKRLEQVNSERVDKRKRLEEKLRQRPSYPQARDIWVFAPKKTMGIQWVILAQDEKKPEFLLTVPADANPMVGSTDVELPKSALCSPLTLRCQYSVSIHKTDFDINGRVGILEKWHCYRALDKIKQISKGKLRSSVLQEETDHDPDYKEWMGQVSKGRKVLLRYFRRRAFYNKLKERVKDFIWWCKKHRFGKFGTTGECAAKCYL